MNDAPIREVLYAIQNQSEFYFLYNSELVDVEKKVNIAIEEEKVDEILTRLFDKNEVDYLIKDRYIVLTPVGGNAELLFSQQQRTVSGKVTDSGGQPLPGVTVVVLGTTQGTVSNSDGNYTLTNIPEDATLVFSFVGMQMQEVEVAGRSVIDMRMEEESIGLEEVIAIGYSTRRQSELSSSISVVSEEELKGVESTDLSTMLQGKVAGLTISNVQGRPGSQGEMQIRGVGSIGAGYSPLIVVDGIIGGDYNPQDIASISVLKDAAATGLYGSRAANGVIIITTKQGKKGETIVSYRGSFGPTFNRDGNVHYNSPQERYDYLKEGYQNFYDDRIASNDPAFTGQGFNEYLEGILPYSLVENATNWQDLMSRTGYSNKHSLSVSGGENKTTFYISGNYYYELGTFLDMDYEEMNLRANISHEISDKFTLFTRFNVGRNENPNDVGSDGAWWTYRSADMWDQAYEADGITPTNPRASDVDWYHSNQTNHLYDRQFYTSSTKRLNSSIDLNLDYRISDWVLFKTSNRVGYSGRDFTEVLDKKHYTSTAELGRVTQDYSYGTSLTTSNILNAYYEFSDHSFAAIIGQEYSHSKRSNTEASKTDLVSGLSALRAAGRLRDISGFSTETGFLSYLGQLDYNYKSRFFIVGSYRRDASSRFGKDNLWGTFYSIGSSWNILQNTASFDLLKVKMSYGKTGNANIADYLSLGTFRFTSETTYNASAGAQPARLPNPNLSWESTFTTNFGLEVYLNNLKLNIDLYNKESRDLLQNVPLPSTTGFDGQEQNIGSIRNRGIDFNIFATIVDRKFKWDANFNFNINRNKVLELSDGEDIVAGSDRAPMRIREGMPLRYYYMREWYGVDPDNGDPLWVRWEDESGNVINGADDITPALITTTNSYNDASLLFIDTPYPDFSGGLRNDFSYNNFTLSTISNFIYGNLLYGGVTLGDGRGGGGGTAMPEDAVRWKQPGDIADYPRNVAGGNKESDRDENSRYLNDASYFRIQNINLSYTFQRRPDFLSLMQVYVSVDYPVVFTKFPGLDPDVSIESPSQRNLGGTGRIPPPRKFLFGVNLNF